jgi:hypothetical protein
MPITNNLKKQIDQPVWEWSRFALTTFNSPASGFATAIDGSNRYIYYQYPGTLQRYDTWSDTWASLAAPAYYTTATIASMVYCKSQGNRGRVLAAPTSSTLTIPSLISGAKLVGQKIRIVSGVGSEQTRTITASTDPVTVESGVNIGSSSATILQDTTKRWQVNQWVGYTVRISYGTNFSFQRTVIFNTVDSLYFSDINLQQYEPWDNQGFISSLSGTFSTYEISSQTVTVDTPFVTTPTTDSRFMIMSGVIWLMSSQTTSGFTWQMYDVLTDVWYQKSMPSTIFSGAVGTEIALTPIDEVEAAYISSTATSATNRRLTDTTQMMVNDQYRNYQIRLTGGTGAGQRRRITSNIDRTFEVDSKWTVTPDATTTYEIWPNTDYIYFVGNANAATFAYDMESDVWVTGPSSDASVATNASITKVGDIPLGIASAADNGTGSVLTVAVNAVGSGYAVNDIIAVSGGAANCRLYITSTTTAGGVTGVAFKNNGSGYATATGSVTSIVSGSGSGCTINITAIGRTGLVTTTINHFLKRGDSVTIAGSSVAGWNGTYTILSVDTNLTFTIASTATATLNATSANSTTLVVDSTKSWDVNEHLGKFLMIMQGGSITPNQQIRRITSNTATTITIPAFTSFTPTSGTTRYVIIDPSSFGRDNKFWADDQLAYGYPTSGTTTSITDTTKNWIRGTWVGHVVRIMAGTGLGNELVITANNNNTITFAAATFTPDTTTRYAIMDSFGTATSGSTTTLVDTGKNWVTNQWVGKRVRFVGGASASNEVTITSNTATTLNFAATTATDATTNYVIYGPPARGAGANVKWTWGNGNHKYLFAPIGGGSLGVSKFDITTGRWDSYYQNSGQGETFTTGSMWAYDGADRVYVQKDQTGRIFYFDIVKREMVNSGTVPYGMSTAFVGNRMEIIKTEDGLKYLYVARHNGTEMWRTLIFW